MKALIQVVLMVGVSGCRSEHAREVKQERVERDRDSAAFRMGEAAHEAAKDAGRAAAVAARKLDEDARRAREGWKEQERKDKVERRERDER
jgi:hypothetical protein